MQLKKDLDDLIQGLTREYHMNRFKDTSLEKLYEYSSTEISDALGGTNVMESQLKPISIDMKIVGRAFTVQLPFGDSQLTHEAIDQAQAGDILVINSSSSWDTAVWGDVKTIKGMKRGIGGIVVDGAIRDFNRNMELRFPIFTKYVVPAASKHIGGGELNIPISCGGVNVNPGDIVFGDENGVVIIPQERLDKVIERASLKKKSDDDKVLDIIKNYN